jgi:hypothetical protein
MTGQGSFTACDHTDGHVPGVRKSLSPPERCRAREGRHMPNDPTAEPAVDEDPATVESSAEDETMRVLVTRLARPHRSGGRAIERASLLSAGGDFDAAVAWIEAHGGEPESAAGKGEQRGLHSTRHEAKAPQPQRFVLPAGALR